MKILIAEDDPIYRHMLESLLTKWGYEVVAAEDGNQAWEILQEKNPPPIAVLDWLMPEMDGVEICKKVREKSKLKMTYVILVTAKGYKEDISAGLKAGADDYITKPFESEELHTSIQTGISSLELHLIQSQKRNKKQVTSDTDSLVDEIDELPVF
jgi:DNA-binding response OmpR family regulator